MKYISEIEIEQPVEKVVDLFEHPANLTRWLTGIDSGKWVRPRQGYFFDRSTISAMMNKDLMIVTKTIVKMAAPIEFDDTYESSVLINRVNSRFEPAGPGRTRYISQQDIQLKGYRKLLAPLLIRAFKSQTRSHLEDFKDFAEQYEEGKRR